jgi:hypothetical protein
VAIQQQNTIPISSASAKIDPQTSGFVSVDVFSQGTLLTIDGFVEETEHVDSRTLPHVDINSFAIILRIFSPQHTDNSRVMAHPGSIVVVTTLHFVAAE